MTTVPFMSTVARELRIASTARASAASLLPRPWRGAAASAPASVTRSSSSARLRLIFGSSIIVDSAKGNGGLRKSATSDGKFVRLHPQLFLAGQASLATLMYVNARPLEDCGDPDPLAIQGG